MLKSIRLFNNIVNSNLFNVIYKKNINIFKYCNNFNFSSKSNDSIHHHQDHNDHDHSHEHHGEPQEYHNFKFDRVSYNQKLTKETRDKYNKV